MSTRKQDRGRFSSKRSSAPAEPPRRRGPKTRFTDAELTERIREVSRLGGWPDESRSRSASFATYGFAYLPQ